MIPIVTRLRTRRLGRKLRDQGSILVESIHGRKDGSTFPVELSIKYVELERGYLVTMARDITERKKAERALTEMAAREALFRGKRRSTISPGGHASGALHEDGRAAVR